MRKSVLSIFPAALLLMAPAAADAFAYMGQGNKPLPLQPEDAGTAAVTWPDNRTDVPMAVGVDPSAYIESVFAAMDEWNAVDTRLHFIQDPSHIAPPCTPNDRINAVGFTFATCDGRNFGDALAVTVVSFRFNNQRQRWEISDADVLVDENRPWEPHSGAEGTPGTVDFYRVVLHELGHVLGLEHPDEAGQTVDAIMNSHVSDLLSLQDDDMRGISFLYGGAPGTGVAANGTGGQGNGGGSGADAALPLIAAFGALLRFARRRAARQ